MIKEDFFSIHRNEREDRDINYQSAHKINIEFVSFVKQRRREQFFTKF